MADHSLTLGSLRLTDSVPDSINDYTFNVLADGMSLGVGNPVQEVVKSLLADGDLVRITRTGNREVTFSVEISGPTLASLADGEAALRRQVGISNLLTWQPPDALAPATVFEIFTSTMAQRFDDLAELRSRRVFELTLTCTPSARSLNTVTVPALDVPGSETLVNFDTCDSATGWTATYNGMPADVSTTWQPGAVSVLDVLQPGGQTLTLTRTGSVNFAGTRYLKVDIGYRADLGVVPIECKTNTGWVLPMVEQRLTAPGRFIYTYDTKGVTVSSLTFKSVTTSDTADLKIYNLARSDMPPSLTPRQSARIIETGGTERTPASIHVFSGNDASGLGLTIVHTSPADGSGYSPPLRRWRVSGNGTPTTDATRLSGAVERIHPNAFRAEVLNSALPPGAYALVAALKSDTAGTFSIIWSTATVTTLGTTGGLYGVTPATFFAANSWHYIPLEIMTLPSVASTGTAKTAIEIKYQGANPPNIDLDEAWLFRVDDDCALTMVADTPSHLWLDSADASSAVPRVWWSTAVDRATQQHPGGSLLTMGAHVLSPGGTTVFSASSSVTYPPIDARYYRRWHSNAAE